MKQRIDCSNTVNCIHEFRRLCRMSSCDDCYLKSHYVVGCESRDRTGCLWRIIENPEQAVSIIQDWSDNNQPDIPTYLEYFKKNFPFDKFTAKNSTMRECFSEDADSVVNFCNGNCIHSFFSMDVRHYGCNGTCYDCWNKPIPEELLKEIT